MSLWEVSEALNVAASQPPASDVATDNFGIADLDALQALVDAEESEMTAQAVNTPASDPAATQRFVNSVFGDGAVDGLPELTLERTETSETNDDEHGLKDELLLAMLRTDGGPWDLDKQFTLEGPESPSPTSVTTLFSEALGGDCSPPDIADPSRTAAFNVALSQRLEVFAEAPATSSEGAHGTIAAPSEGAQGTIAAPSEGAHGTLVALALPSTSQLGNSRNGAERKEWTAEEDEIIHTSVLIHGCKWRRIAALLPGRSDDAVRNRWNRLREQQPGAPALPAGAASAPAAKRTASASSEGVSKPERVSWTKAEDATILNSVAELGHKWNKLAERLPGRTDHAIRNRFHRLQTMLEDKQREQQRMLAPAELLPPMLAIPLALT